MASFPHSAPPVVYPLGRSRFEGALLGLAWLAGALLTLAWAFELARADWRLLCGGLAVLAAGAVALAAWRRPLLGELGWDGQRWRVEATTASAGVEVEVVADFQRALLLRLARPAGRALWCWLERGALPERWADLRRAAHARGQGAATAVAVSAHSDAGHAPGKA